MDESNGVVLLHQDVKRMSSKMKVSPEAFLRDYCLPETKLSAALAVRVMKLRFKKGGDCIFLSSDLKCEIYKDRPFQCRHTPERILSGGENQQLPCVQEVDLITDEVIAREFSEALKKGL